MKTVGENNIGAPKTKKIVHYQIVHFSNFVIEILNFSNIDIAHPTLRY